MMAKFVETDSGFTHVWAFTNATTYGLRVKINAGILVWVAGASDNGVTIGNVVAAGPMVDTGVFEVTVKLRTAQGTLPCIANAAITAGAVAYSANDGKVAPTGSTQYGIALDTATADGDLIEVLPV